MSLFFIVFGVGTYNTSHALPRDTVLTYIMLLGCVSIKISGGANIFNIINVSGGASITHNYMYKTAYVWGYLCMPPSPPDFRQWL